MPLARPPASANTWRRYRVTLRTLDARFERDLRDVGFERDQLARIARRAAARR